LMIDAANAAGIEAGIRTRTFAANSTSITGSTHAAPCPAFGDGTSGGDMSARISLRLSEGLKNRVEEAAAGEGVSVNSYIVRTLERGASAHRIKSGRGANRLRGYGST